MIMVVIGMKIKNKRTNSSEHVIFRGLINERLTVSDGGETRSSDTEQALPRVWIYGIVVKHASDLRLFRMFSVQDYVQPLPEQHL